MIVSPSLALTARLEAGQRARLIPLTGSKQQSGVPSIRQARDAMSIKLREVEPQSDKVATKSKNWLALLAREVLSKLITLWTYYLLTCALAAADLKYVTSKQVIEFVYESKRRRFSIAGISSSTSDELETQLSDLQLSTGSPKIWLANWDTTVSILEDQPAQRTVSQVGSIFRDVEVTENIVYSLRRRHNSRSHTVLLEAFTHKSSKFAT